MIWYSGCNLNINQGKVPSEPIGTATAMHECGDCPNLEWCGLKQSTAVFKYDEEQRKKFDILWGKLTAPSFSGWSPVDG